MRLNLILLAVVLFITSSHATNGNEPSTRPNIVILYADDMGYGDLGVQNPDSKIPTPNLDRLAKAGMRFTDGHSSSGVCTPSRYALLTGRFHWRKFHSIVNSFGPPAIDSELTIAEVLKSKGYRTACVGKWHLGWNWNDIKKPGAKPEPVGNGKELAYAPSAFDWSKPISGGPLSHGFDYYFGDDVPNFPPYAWFENNRVITVPSEPLNITAQTAEGNWESRPGPMTPGWDFYAVVPKLRQKTVEWIEQQKGKQEPFFLYVPFNSPHAPMVPTEQYIGKSNAGGYGDFLVQTDDNIGAILDAIEVNGFADNTLVIFTSDNGPERYAYERLRKFQHRSAGPLRGLKRDIYEGGHRVPFLVKWPGVIQPNTVSDALVSQIDLMATIAGIVGYVLPSKAADDSYSLLQVWKDNAPSPRHSIVHNTNSTDYAIRHEDWVLIANKTGAQSAVPDWFDRENGYGPHDQPAELYNLKEDLSQKKNLFAQRPDKVKELTALLETIRAKGQVR